ncbi:EpsG family protein [Clostridium perfringens]|nr:Uncharacterised protein [Clostridium perfringens]
MLYIITIIMLVLNFINAYYKKYIKFIPYLLLILMWIIYFGNYENPDYHNYLSNYNNLEPGNDFGFFLLKNFFYTNNISYHTFLSIISAIGLFLIYKTIKKIGVNYSYIYILYFIYPFLLDVVQIRNFIIMSIFIYSIPYLLSNNNIDKIKYCILILIASTFQLTAIIYLPIVFLPNIKKYRFSKKIFILFILIIFILSLSPSFLNLIRKTILSLSEDSRLESWMNIKSRYGFLIYWGIQIINFILVKWCNDYLIKEEKSIIQINGISLKKFIFQKEFVNLVYYINMYAFLFLPFYRFQSTFTRFMRNIIILNLIVYCVYNLVKKKLHKTRINFNLIILIYTLFLFYIEIYIGYKDTIIKAIFENNIFFK